MVFTAGLHLAHHESAEVTCLPNPHPRGFCFHWTKTPLLYPTQTVLSLILPAHGSPLLPPFLLSTFPFSTHPTSLAHNPKGTEEPVAHTSPLSLWFSRANCNTVTYFTSVRFAGERRAPQKKVLSWKRQRMQESRCQSKNMSSRSPAISTTTCAGPLPPGSGTRPSRCVSAQNPFSIPSSQL